MYHCYYFQVAIDDISVKMQENFQCRAKLQGLAEQYEEREKVNCDITMYNCGNLIKGLKHGHK